MGGLAIVTVAVIAHAQQNFHLRVGGGQSLRRTEWFFRRPEIPHLEVRQP